LIGAGLMFALRQWAGSWIGPSIPAIGVSAGAGVGNLPAISLPLLAAVLGGFFEIDNTGESDGAAKGGPSAIERKRVATGGAEQAKPGNAAAGASAPEPDDEADLGPGRRAKR